MRKKLLTAGWLLLLNSSFSVTFGQHPANGPKADKPSQASSISYQDLFIGGRDQVTEYRIPSFVVTKKGTLIAVCDARVDKPGDAPNNIDIVVKRSFDNGKHWTKQQTVLDYPGNDAAADASMVVDRQTGTIWLAYDYAVADPQGNIGRILRLHLIKSTDDGVTWSRPVELNTLTKGKDFWLQNGPGVGIYTNGALVFPMYTATQKPNGPQQTVLVVSKDHGKTWEMSNGVGEYNVEPQVAGLTGGRIVANMRRPRGQQYRQIAVTTDLGKSWSPACNDSTLIEPGCQGSLINYSSKKGSRLIFSNPADVKERKNLVLRVSRDEGKSWQKELPVYAGSAAYSCLTQLPNGNVGLLYEADEYKKIVFAEIPAQLIVE